MEESDAERATAQTGEGSSLWMRRGYIMVEVSLSLPLSKDAIYRRQVAPTRNRQKMFTHSLVLVAREH